MIDTRETTINRNHLSSPGHTSWRLYLIPTLLIICTVFGLGACTEDGEGEATNQAGQTTQSSTTSRNSSGGQTGAKLNVKVITASGAGEGNSVAKNAVDGDVTTQWSAGGPAPQWIQLDLGEEMSVSKIRLLSSQVPAGATTHQVYAGTAPDQLQLIGTLDGTTQDNQWLELTPSVSNIRYLKINTTKSPSWTAWREIEIFK